MIATQEKGQPPSIPAVPNPPPHGDVSKEAGVVALSGPFKTYVGNDITQLAADLKIYNGLLAQYKAKPTQALHDQITTLHAKMVKEAGTITTNLSPKNLADLIDQKFPQYKADSAQIASWLIAHQEKGQPPVIPAVPNPPHSQGALAQIEVLDQKLADPSISKADRIKYTEELYELLSETGAASKQYGPISGPITNKDASGLPSVTSGTVVPADQTAWEKGANGYIPTNDWMEQMAAYPNNDQATNSTGPYNIQWDIANGQNTGMTFKMPVSFQDNGDWIQQNLNGGFSISAQGVSGKPLIQWQAADSGNMVRNVSYNNGGLVIHAAQGSLFQGAIYKGMTPSMHLPTGGKMDPPATLPDGTKKYRIVTNDSVYYIYGNSSLALNYDSKTGDVTGSGPYTGSINMVSLPAKDPNLSADEKTLDAHANAVVVKGQGTLLPGDQYQFQYVTEDLSGNPTAEKPLIMLKAPQVKDLADDGLATKESLTATTLTGEMDAYSGSSFVFNVPKPNASTSALPQINGKDPLTKAQAQQLISSGELDKGIASAMQGNPSGTTAYNKGIYQMGLTLNYAQKVMEIAGMSESQIKAKLDPLYQHMETSMTGIFKNFELDKSWGTIVGKDDGYGDHSDLNDHIVQYGYPLYALTLMKTYGDKYIAPKDQFINQQSGIGSYTNKDIGDLLASDIGETGKGDFPKDRNLDVYNSHSWISGIGKSLGSGNNTESESEAVLGSMSVAAWLQSTQPNSTQAQLAETRWSVESQGLHTYYQNDPASSAYNKIAPGFVKNHPVTSMVWQGKICAQTWWGGNWDRIIACESMPAGANLMDNFLNNTSPAYQKELADYIVKNWASQPYDSNAIQSVLIATVAKVYPDKARDLIQQMEKNGNKFDAGTNSFILNVVTDYAQNEQASK